MKTAAIRAALGLGLLYLTAGLVFGALAGQAGSHQLVVAWRLAAWTVSAIAFGAHIVYEQIRMRSSPSRTAFRVASGAALGAFGLAAAANIHSLSVSPDQRSRLLVASLIIWPIITALPAFVVALVAAALLSRLRRSAA